MKIKTTYYFIILSFSLLFSCKKETTTKTISNSTTSRNATDTIYNIKKRVSLLKLNSNLKTKVKELDSYSNAKQYIDSLNIAPYSILNELTTALNEQLEEFTKELDTDTKTNGVLSRIKQIETYSRAVNFEASKNTKDTLKIKATIIKALNSYNKLVVQLNETNIKLPENLKKQLKSRTIIKDSIKGEPLF